MPVYGQGDFYEEEEIEEEDTAEETPKPKSQSRKPVSYTHLTLPTIA